MQRSTIIRTAALFTVAALGITLAPDTSEARIKLATLPAKQNAQVRFDHPSLVFCEEERVIALQGPSEGNPAGLNTIDFSWAGTTIDMSSIVLRPVKADPKVRMLSTSYPPGENALTWQVACDEARSETFRISYLMGSIDRETSYNVVVSNDDSKLNFKHLFRIGNQSGEDFDNAKFVLAGGQDFDRSVDNGDSMRVLVRGYDNVKAKKEYLYDVPRRSQPTLDEPVRFNYVIKNDKESGLGMQPLDYGKVRIFKEDGHGGTAFLGEDWGKFTAVGDEMRLYIGVSQDIKIERKLMKEDKENVRGNVYDTDEVWQYEIKNFKNEAVTVKIVDRIAGEWEFQSDSSHKITKQVNNEEVEFEVAVTPKGTGESTFVKLHIKRKNNW